MEPKPIDHNSANEEDGNSESSSFPIASPRQPLLQTDEYNDKYEEDELEVSASPSWPRWLPNLYLHPFSLAADAGKNRYIKCEDQDQDQTVHDLEHQTTRNQALDTFRAPRSRLSLSKHFQRECSSIGNKRLLWAGILAISVIGTLTYFAV
ncbi:hypothetical protein IAT40_003187 [Kwoniella sp. CBS 6097]